MWLSNGMKLSQKSVHFRYSNYCLFPLCIIQINALFFDEKKIWSKFQTFQLFNFMIKTVRFSVTIFFIYHDKIQEKQGKLNIQWETTAAVYQRFTFYCKMGVWALFAFCCCAICIVSGFSWRIKFSGETWAIKLLWEFKSPFSTLFMF